MSQSAHQFAIAARNLVLEDELVTIVRDIYPDLSPDGTKVAFHSNRASFADREGLESQIFVLDLQTRRVSQLTHGPRGHRDPVWSPDGQQIVYSVGDDETRAIYVMGADGSSPRALLETDEAAYHPKWFPDGRGIIFDSDRDHDPTDRITNREIYTMELASGTVQRLTDYPDWDTFASISPDGRKIVWRRVVDNPDGTRNAEIFVMNRDGSEMRRLTDTPAFDAYPTWSPDGRKILFSSNRDEDHYEDFNIYWMNPDGTDVERLTETLHQVEQIRARFSSDGTRIIYNRQYLDGRIEIRARPAPPFSSPQE